jgi:hypothetical protein
LSARRSATAGSPHGPVDFRLCFQAQHCREERIYFTPGPTKVGR